jgi:hypothetical protein
VQNEKCKGFVFSILNLAICIFQFAINIFLDFG